MTDELEVGNPSGAAVTNQPVSSTKPIDGTPQQSQEFLEIKKQLELTRKELQGLQGRQDKEQNEVQRFMGEVKKRMAAGQSLEEAEKSIVAEQKNAEREELIFKIAQKVGVLDTPAQSPAGNGTQVPSEKAMTLQSYGLNENDPDVAENLSGKNLTGLELKLAAAEIALKRKNQPTPDVSASPAAVGNPPAPKDLKSMTEDYKKKIIAARGNKALGKQIQDEFRKQGGDPGSVGFNL